MSSIVTHLSYCLNKLNSFQLGLVQYQMRQTNNNFTVVKLDDSEKVERIFAKEVKKMYETLKRVQTQNPKKVLPGQQNPFKKIAEVFNSFKIVCKEIAQKDEELEEPLYEIEKKIKEESDRQALNHSGPRLQDYILPNELNAMGEFLIGFQIEVKKTAYLYTKWGVSKISIIYPKDCYAPYPPDMVNKGIRRIAPWIIEIAILNEKGEMLNNHPLFQDSLPRFYNYRDLVDFLDQLAVTDNVKTNNNFLGLDFLNQKNKYFD